MLVAEMDSEAAYEILKNRAEQLARVDFFSVVNMETLVYTEFILAGEHYGIENKYISEIRPLKGYTTIPGTPAHLLGIINSRGKILSIVDLRTYFNLDSEGISDRRKVIIMMNEKNVFGLVVDEVIGVGQCNENEHLGLMPIIKRTNEKVFKGMTSSRIVILEGANLLNDQSLVVNERT